MDCWANCISGCSNNITKEHYVSDGFFEGKNITAFGLHWCKDEPIKIGLASAVAKILCTTHNNALSPYDSEAKNISEFITESIREKPLEHHCIDINGWFLEKWALKTLFNLAYIGGLDQTNFTKLTPPENLVSYLFSDIEVKEGVGLYFISTPINSGDYSNSISWNAIHNLSNDGEIIGMTFSFNGLRFIINTQPVQAEEIIKNMGVVKGIDYSKSEVVYRPKVINFRSNTAGTKTINLKW
jgi:hypothetical protein